MISSVLWRTQFGAAPDVVNRSIDLDDTRYRIVGVLPEGFRFPHRTDVITPLAVRMDSGTAARTTYLSLLGKLRPGADREHARTEMNLFASRLAAVDAKAYAGASIVVQNEMLDRRGRNFLPAPTLFLTGGLVLLLVACANVANLFYVRTAERRTEMAVRASLGAGTGRLLRQALTESALISAAAALAGIGLANLLVRVWLHFMPTAGFPSWFHVAVDWRIVAFASVVTTVVTIAVGLAPALEGARFDLVRTLKGHGGTSHRNASRGTKRGLVLQLALSMALFIASALLARSYQRLATLNLGYPADKIATVRPFFTAPRYPETSARITFADMIRERAATLPDVEHAAVRGPFNKLRDDATLPAPETASSKNSYAEYFLPDGDTTRKILRYEASSYAVSNHYFDVIGLKLRAGRLLSDADAAGAPPVVVLSAQAVTKLFGTRPAVGRFLQAGRFGVPIHVIGVVDDVRELHRSSAGLRAEPAVALYLSERQAVSASPEILARVRNDAAPAHALMADLVRAADARLMLDRDVSLANQFDESYLVIRVFGGIIGVLAASALFLSVIGIYGVVAFGVAQCTREIGVRIALGSTGGGVTRLVTWQAARFIGMGLGAGLLLAAGIARFLGMFLIDLSPLDPLAYAGATILFGIVAFAASYLPARRAARLDPVAALRSD